MRDVDETWVLFFLGLSFSSGTSSSQLVLLKGHPTASSCILFSLVSERGEPWYTIEANLGDTPVFHRLNKLTSVSSSNATSFNRQTEFLCYEIFPWNSNFPLFFFSIFSIQYFINYKHQLFMLMRAHFTKTEIKWQVMLRWFRTNYRPSVISAGNVLQYIVSLAVDANDPPC